MSDLSQIVDSLENKVSKLLHKYELLKQTNVSLTREIEQIKQSQLKNVEKLENWQEKYNSLKVANSMLGSDNYKRETKLKINALVREIDQCIIQLSE